MNERMYYVLNEILNLGYTNMEIGINYVNGTNGMSEDEIAKELNEYMGRIFFQNGDQDLAAWDNLNTNYLYIYAREEDVDSWIHMLPDFLSEPETDDDKWIFIFA